MEDINTVGTTGKTVEQIASDWKNTKMTKFEIVKHFVEICKLDEEALAREIEETKKWQHDVLELQKQNRLVWREVDILQEKINKAKKVLDICEEYKIIEKYWIDALLKHLGE